MVANPSVRGGAAIVASGQSPHGRLCPLGVTAVQLTDRFWAPRRARNRAVTLPEQHRQCVATGRLDNFRRAAGMWQGPFQGKFFNDSDAYKWHEAAAWTLVSDDDPQLRAHVDDLQRGERSAWPGPSGRPRAALPIMVSIEYS